MRLSSLGLGSAKPWSLSALRLVCRVPRTYPQLLTAWDKRYPGTVRAVNRLTELGLLAHQPSIILDQNGNPQPHTSPKCTRWRITSRGVQALRSPHYDALVETSFSFVDPNRSPLVRVVLERLHQVSLLPPDQAQLGSSVNSLCVATGLAASSLRRWLTTFAELGWIAELATKHADVREVVPEHWRVTPELCRQLRLLTAAIPGTATMLEDLRLHRRKFLGPVSLSTAAGRGVTDFRHDVLCQSALALILGSERCDAGSVFVVEPHMQLATDLNVRPYTVHRDAAGILPYQPDSAFTEIIDGQRVRTVVEYERQQSRRAAWNHIERFLGHVSLYALPFERTALRFVLDPYRRIEPYVELIEAFAEYALAYPERMPPNPVMLAVTRLDHLQDAPDPLAPRVWARVALARGSSTDTDTSTLLVHPPEASPYNDYCAAAAA